MAWNLFVYTIDVSQGESSLIIADDPAIPQRRTMLVDGGESRQGSVVNQFIAARGINAVDHILITHYDTDHSGGIMSLLEADNFHVICQYLATSAATWAVGNNRPQQIASAAAAICAAILGAYDDPGGAQHANYQSIVALAVRMIVPATYTDAQAAALGIKEAEDDLRYSNLNPVLVPIRSTAKRRATARLAAIAAVNALAAGTQQAAAYNAVYGSLRTIVKSRPQFRTMGRFNQTHMIDTGNTFGLPGIYTALVGGYVMMSSTWIKAPGINRTRSTPGLGTECLWNSGPNAIVAPVNAPAVYVLARNAYVWHAPPNTVPLAQALDNNNDSFGLVLRFNNFFFYTGGDLVSAGENLIADAIRGYGLPNPNNNNNPYPIPASIAAFKCGHHGADTCTSNYFLQTLNPKAALISSGRNSYGHPNQNLVNRLQACNSLSFFYLTGCDGTKINIPASYIPPQNQLTTAFNKSRVAGYYNPANPLGPNAPGNIQLSVDEAQSLSALLTRHFTVTYYDEDTPFNYRTENNLF